MNFGKVLSLTLGVGVFAVVVGVVDSREVDAQTGIPVNVVNTPAHPVPTVVQSLPARTLVHDGKAFSLAPNPNIAFEFGVPANVVLTDVVLTLNAPSLATTIFVAEGDTSKTYVFQSVGSANSTWAGSNEGRATIHFQSGLQSPNGLRVGLTCNNIGGNTCAGALMWSGYQP